MVWPVTIQTPPGTVSRAFKAVLGMAGSEAGCASSSDVTAGELMGDMVRDWLLLIVEIVCVTDEINERVRVEERNTFSMRWYRGEMKMMRWEGRRSGSGVVGPREMVWQSRPVFVGCGGRVVDGVNLVGIEHQETNYKTYTWNRY